MNKITSFMFGVCIGSLGTYFITKKIIEERTDEEIESVVSTFKNRFDKVEKILTEEQKKEVGIYSVPNDILEEHNDEKDDKISYKEKTEELGYVKGVDLSDNQDQHAEYVVNIGSAPYIITEEEFGEIGNEEETLILYADGILATEDEDPIDDVESLIGNCLNEMGEHDDLMYVRNQENETDYVILRSEKMYKDIVTEVND
jgi:hypothetical protein